MRARPALSRLTRPVRRSFASAALALAATVAAAGAAPAQVAQSARPAKATTVRYVVLWRTEFLERPSPTAPVIAWLDSAQVLTPTEPELYQTGHARIVVNGRTGWVDNGYIRRVVTLHDTARLVDTVKVDRRTPAPAARTRGPLGQPAGVTKKP